MKKKLGLFITTAIFTLVVTMTSMAYEIVIEGEEKTGKEYPTTTENYYEWKEGTTPDIYDVKETYEVEVHLIPKGERFRFDDVDNISNTMICTLDVYLGDRTSDSDGDPAFNGSSEGALFGDTISFDYTDGYHDLYNFIKNEPIWKYHGQNINSNFMYDQTWCTFVRSFNTDEDYDYTLSGLDAYYFRFVDAPLLVADLDDNTQEETKDKNSDSSSSSKSSSGKSSGGGGGSPKAITTKKIDTDTYSNAVWQQEENGKWSLKKSTGETITGWAKVKNIWYHVNPETGVMSTGWLTDTDGKNYYLMDTGAMAQGWNLLDNKWFYFENNGSRFSGWLLDKNGKWYYLDVNGIMLANTATPDGYKVDSSGAWIQ